MEIKKAASLETLQALHAKIDLLDVELKATKKSLDASIVFIVKVSEKVEYLLAKLPELVRVVISDQHNTSNPR